MMSKFLPLFALVLTLASFAFSEEAHRYLHISTNPSYADAYVNTSHRNFAANPDASLPGFIEIPADEHSVLVTIFKPGYRDTTINVTLAENDTSYLIVSLAPSYDDVYLERQQKALSHRTRRNIGFKLAIASGVPLIASGIAALVAEYNIDKADEKKALIEKSLIREGDEYAHNLESYREHRDNAESAKKFSVGTLIAGAVLLGFGIVLSF